MAGEIDAAGDAVTGILVAHAVEPQHGRPRGGAHGDGHGGHCLNCRAELTGAYCAACGQPAHVHRTVGALWHDLLHSVLHVEGKIWQTLPELARRPGQLTRRYIHGERARFVSPFALFLFSAFLMYGVYSLTGSDGSRPLSARESAEELKEELADADRKIADIEASLRERDLTPKRQARLERRLAAAREDRKDLAVAGTIVEGIDSRAPDAAAKAGSILQQFRSDPGLFAYKLKANAYKFSWLLILISTPFVWLLFAGKRGYGLYDHSVFVTYSIAFMSLLFSVWMIVSAIGIATGILTLALMLYALWHMYRQMKDAYRLSRRGAVIRLPFLYSFAAVSGGMFYALVSAVS
jgi:hypothetical protein